MSDILLTHSYFLRFDQKQWHQMKPYPPLGTLYAASVLQQSGYSVALFDPMFSKSENEIVPYLIKSQPKYVIFFEDSFNYLSKMCLSRMREACFRMTNEAKKFGCIVVAQGSDPVDHLQEYFNNDIDYVICGEGEITLIELLQEVQSGTKDLSHVKGIAYHDKMFVQNSSTATSGKIFITQKREVIRDLDTLPFPAWELIDIERYKIAWKSKHDYFSLNVVTTRGCPFHCNWCAKPVYGQVYNSRSPKNVVEEIKLLREKYHIDHLWFTDDIFGLKPGWVSEFNRLVNEANVVTPFVCQSRVDLLLKENTIAEMAKAGCETVWVGAESGSQKILDAMEKGIRIEQIYHATKSLKENNIRVSFFLQFGYPEEMQEDIEKTLKMVRECEPDDIGISVSYPLPGTKFYDRVKASLTRKQNWITSNDLDIMFPGTYHPDFYRALHKVVHKNFRIRQAMHAMRSMDFTKQNIRRILLLIWNVIALTIAQGKLILARSKRPISPLASAATSTSN